MKKKIAVSVAMALLACSVLAGCNDAAESNEVTVPKNDPAKKPDTVTLHLIKEKRAGRPGGELLERTVAAYDERGLRQSLVREKYSFPDMNFHYEYHYNEQGHLLFLTTMENGQEISQSKPYEYQYNPDGSIASIKGYFEGCYLKYSGFPNISEGAALEFEYDQQGRLKQATTNYFDGTPWVYASCQYNAAGALEQYTNSIPGGPQFPGVTYVAKFIHDDQGQLTSVEVDGGEGCKYDEYGNIIQKGTRYYTYSASDRIITNMQDVFLPNQRYIYDELGRLVRMESENYYEEWDYQTIEVPWENLNMSIVYFSLDGDCGGIDLYYDKIENYLLPMPHRF